MVSVFVGVDVSKDLFSAAGLDGQGKELFSRSYEMDSNGFSEFLKVLSSHDESLDQVLVGMESTGCYHINLFSFLHDKGIHVVVINPLLIANFAKLEYPSARLVRVAKPKAIAKALKGPYIGNKLTFSSEDILRAARSSVGVTSPAKEVILRGKIATLLHLKERLGQTTKLLTDLCKATRLEDLKIMRSIKGVGPKTAAPFLAEMGEIDNFTSHKKLIAFAGWDPSVRRSGKFVGISKISKRGNRHLRRAIYLMTASVVSQNAFFKAYFLKRKREGLPPQKALCATVHKLLRVIFAMLTQRTYFKPKEVIQQ